MPIATGVFKTVTYKRQAALKTIAPAGGAGTSQNMRRTTSTLDLTKATYASAELLPSQQRRDMRHGVRGVSGSLAGELSVGTYQQLFESALRGRAVAPVNTGAQVNITAASSGAGTGMGTYTRAAGSFLTDGFKVGDVISNAGWTTTGVANNGTNAVITALTATVMTVLNLNRSDIGAKAAGDPVTISQAGRKVIIPATAQYRDYYTIEHWHSDIGQSERYVDCAITGVNVGLPPTGMATVEFPVLGLDMQTGAAQYFVAPAAVSTGAILAAVNGAILINGNVVGTITGISFSLAGNHSVPGGVVGSNVDPDIFPGPIDVTGSMTVLFDSATYRDLFLNETEALIAVALTGGNAAGAAFTNFILPRVKYTGATKDDTAAGLTLTMPFTALENTGSVANADFTTLAMQDSAFV